MLENAGGYLLTVAVSYMDNMMRARARVCACVIQTRAPSRSFPQLKVATINRPSSCRICDPERVRR